MSMDCGMNDGWDDPVVIFFSEAKKRFFFSANTSQHPGEEWKLEFWYHKVHEQIREEMALGGFAEILNPDGKYRIAARFMYGDGEQFRAYHPENNDGQLFIERIVTRDEFDSMPKCPQCNMLLEVNPYDYRQKYCPGGCKRAIRLLFERENEDEPD